MSDPITAATIATLLLMKFTEGTAGETGKKLVTSLWDKIAARFQGNKQVERTLATIETEKTPEAAQPLVAYLGEEMKYAPDFAEEIRQLARQINTLNQTESGQINTNYGRDQFVINQPTGDLKLGG
jgi:hypothetical protein